MSNKVPDSERLDAEGPEDVPEHEIDDYLWDGSGPVQPDIARLEQMLAPLRYEQPLDELGVRKELRRQRRRRLVPVVALAAAAAIALAVVSRSLWTDARSQRVAQRDAVDAAAPEPGSAAWAVSALDGTTTAAGRALSGAAELRIGEWLETGADARARLSVADIGILNLGASSRLRIVNSGADEHRVELARGSIHAVISAPPRLFLVETASALAVDLGCEYTLKVDESGRGLLHVTLGYVALERAGIESFVPAGAKCETRPGLGPGTPYDEEADEGLIDDLRRYDERADDVVLARILSRAGRSDSVSLWNLFRRAQATGQEGRAERIYERLAALVPPPEGAARVRLLAGDADALTWWRMTLEDIWLGYEE